MVVELKNRSYPLLRNGKLKTFPWRGKYVSATKNT
jgi:hypothetical protein